MDARLTKEQQQMQETAIDFVEASGGTELARRMLDGDDDVVDEVWSEIRDLDFTTLTVPFDYGGLGEGMVYLSAILEGVGRYALPGPFPETMAFGAPLLAEHGSDDQKEGLLSDIATGDVNLSFALYDDRNTEIPDAITMDATPTNGGYRLDGTKTLVPYADEVDRVVVAARTRDGSDFDGLSLFLVDPADAVVDPLDSLDRTRPLSELTFDDVAVDDAALVGGEGAAGGALVDAIDRFTVATCAMLVGAATRAVELSVEHGNEREQYGHPVGRYQAVKHRTAEMWIAKEHARSLTYRAAWALDEGAANASRAVSMANAFVGQELPDVFGSDIFNHGGMGFTWDHDGHIYLKQAKAWQNYLGSPEYHLDRVADSRNYAEDTLPGYPELSALAE